MRDRGDLCMAVEAAMSERERDDFLQMFTGMNSHTVGIHVADALDMLSNSDAHLDVTEPLYETGIVTEDDSRWPLLGLCALAVIYAYGETEVRQCWVCHGTGDVEGVPALGIPAGICSRCDGVGHRLSAKADQSKVEGLMNRIVAFTP